MGTISTLWSVLAVTLLCAAKALAGETVASAEPFEINAVTSQAGRYDYVLYVSGNPFSSCTGTLISDNVVMTAAHCFAYGPRGAPALNSLVIKTPYVRSGYNLTETTFPATPGTAIAIHPLYRHNSKDLRFDIALIRIDVTKYQGPPPTFLPTPIKHIGQVPISSADYNTTVTSLGWGNTNPTKNEFTQFLRDVNLTLTDPSSPACQGLPGYIDGLDDNTSFCMFGSFPTDEELPNLPAPSFPDYRKGVCFGDSGGPTIVQGATAADDVLIGVNAHLLSSSCGNNTSGDVSTSVGAYANFIKSMLHEFQDDGLPIVNITGLVVSQIGYGSHGFGKSGQITFLVNLSVQTNYLMERVGVFDNYGALPNPGFALRLAGPGHNATTVLPLNITRFDVPSFTYTLEAADYQVVADFALDFIGGQVRMDTGLQVLFKPFGENDYMSVVAEVSTQQLKKALCGTPGPHDTVVTALFQAFCSRA